MMERLVQIVYVSRSTFIPTGNSAGIEPKISRILAKSRVNNRKNGLAGVLYFGDGCFFQCLEGKEAEIDKLYAKLEQDPRHKELMLISRKQITNLSFTNWAMKYVPLEDKLNAELKANGYDSFDPYKFDAAMTAKVLNLLQTSTNEDKEDLFTQPVNTAPAVKQLNNNFSTYALILSVISLAISIFNLSRGHL